MGNGAMTGRHTPSYTLIKDTGYTSYCPYCVTRSGDDSELIGRPRELAAVVCLTCVELKKRERQMSAREKGWSYRNGGSK